jgi:hypothetical protein
LRDADRILIELRLSGLHFVAGYTDSIGRELRCLNLPKQECLILVSGYSIELRAGIIVISWLATRFSNNFVNDA